MQFVTNLQSAGTETVYNRQDQFFVCTLKVKYKIYTLII